MNSHHEVDYDGQHDDDDVAVAAAADNVQGYARQLTEIYGAPYAVDQLRPACCYTP